MDTPRLRLSDVRKSFGGTSVLAGIDLAIAAGAFCVFVGPSGCGKSTLLRLIAGLDEPDGGDIAIDGRVVNALPPAERDVAMVFQSYALYPHMSAHENMAFGLRHRRLARDEIARRIEQAARLLQLDGLLARKPRELSGGQRQRVAIGRAIVREPRLFLFDEPLSNLDAALRAATRLELARLHRELGATMVYVTHDQVEAMTLADIIVLLRPLSDGAATSIAQIGAPLDLYHRPADRFVAGFIGSPAMNFTPATVSDMDSAGVGLRLGTRTFTAFVRGDSLERGAAVTLGIRPEHVRLDGALPGEAVHVERLGEHSILHVRIEGGHLLQVKTVREDIARGDRLTIDLPSTALHVFDASGRALPHL